MLADYETILQEQSPLKERACELLLRVYKLDRNLWLDQPEKTYGQKVLRNGIMIGITGVLEELFIFFQRIW